MCLLGGCSAKDSDDRAAAVPGKPQNVWSGQVKALDQAKQLEQDMNAAYQKKAAEIDQQTR